MADFVVTLNPNYGDKPVHVEANGFTVTNAGALILWEGDYRGTAYGPQRNVYTFADGTWAECTSEDDPSDPDDDV